MQVMQYKNTDNRYQDHYKIIVTIRNFKVFHRHWISDTSIGPTLITLQTSCLYDKECYIFLPFFFDNVHISPTIISNTDRCVPLTLKTPVMLNCCNTINYFLTLENDLISSRRNYIFGSATFTLPPATTLDNFVTLTRTLRNV